METEEVVLGGGCFWCTEAVFTMLNGVMSVEPGYAGPMRAKAPTYEEVSTGTTAYVESVKIIFNPEQLAFEEILRVFFASHDPTTLNQQGADVGPQYASVIFCTTQRQAQKAQHYVDVLNGVSRPDQSVGAKAPIVTRVERLEAFYPAEDYHKNYYAKNKSAGYCQLVIAPKVEAVGEKFKHLRK
jgi:peptide-methionine (S)-S-oxide reductase